MRLLPATLVAAIAIVGGGCGTGDGTAADRPGATTSTPAPGRAPGASTTAAADAAPADEAAAAPGPFATTAVSTPPEHQGLLTAVRVGTHRGFVRVVFEFRDAVPGYRVDYGERPIVEDGSGNEVELAGDEALLVSFEPASAVELRGEEAVPTYRGPRRVAIASDAVPEVVRVGDFEGRLQWAAGLDRRRPFRVFALASPPRVVLDVSTAAA